MSHRALTFIVLASLTLAGAVQAQPDRHTGAPGFGADNEEHFASRRLEKVAEFLELSESQSYEWETLQSNQRESQQAVRKALSADQVP